MLLSEDTDNDATGIKVYSVESEAAIIKAIVDVAGLSNFVEVVEGFSYDVLNGLKQKEDAFVIDVLLLDHWDKYYRSDVELCVELGMLKAGSLIMADNTDFPGASDYMQFVTAEIDQQLPADYVSPRKRFS
ncbi:S-adenosyl-L-methionine-dependent methyltransferase [Venturia nashicola]|nr:S-adenosyl-L-methionine-dependent methyltransferase [Venturia nashicola]